MVDQATYLLAVCDGQRSGTLSTLLCAQKRGLIIKIIKP